MSENPTRRRVGLWLRAQRTWQRFARRARTLLGLTRTVYVQARVEEYRGYWQRAAEALGAQFLPLTGEIWEVRRGAARTRIANYLVETDDPVTLRLAGDKLFCYGIATSLGIAVPDHLPFRLPELRSAERFRVERGGAFVVKPVRGTSSGIGVSTLVRSARELERAAVLASLFCDDLLIESMVAGESYRLLFLDGRLLHAVRRAGLRVTGSRGRTLGQLLHEAGASPSDPLVAFVLAERGWSLDQVVPEGLGLVVRNTPVAESSTRELRTQYDESVTPLISQALIDQLSPALAQLGSEFTGIDIVTVDPSVSLRESGGRLLELNTTPGIHHHYIVPAEIESNAVAIRVLDYLLQPERRRRSASLPRP